MKEELIKLLFKTKLQIIDYVENFLPENVRTEIDDIKYSLLRAVNVATLEYLETSPQKRHEKDIKNITID